MKIFDAELILNTKFQGLTVVVGECGSGKSAFMKTILANEIISNPDSSILCISEYKMEYIALIKNIVLEYGEDYFTNLKLMFIDLDVSNFKEVITNTMNNSEINFDLCIFDGLIDCLDRKDRDLIFRQIGKISKKTFATIPSRKMINDNNGNYELSSSFGIAHQASFILKIQKNQTMSLNKNYVADDLFSISFIKNRYGRNISTTYLSLDLENKTLYFKPKNSEKNFFNLPKESIINYNEVFLPVHSNINKFFEEIKASKKIKKIIYSKAIINMRDSAFFINYDILLLAEVAYFLSEGNVGIFQKYLTVINTLEYNLLTNVPKNAFVKFAHQLSSKLKNDIFNGNTSSYILIDSINMYRHYSTAYGVDIEFHQKNIKEVHDFLQIRISDIKYNHIVIEQQKKISKLNGLKYSNLSFRVPFDHKEVIMFGTKMNICVGSTSTYFEKIQEGKSYIAFCIDENENPIICIELTSAGDVIQIKGINNSQIDQKIECDIKLTIGGLFCH